MNDNILRPHIIIKTETNPPVKREYDGGGGGTYPRTSYQQHAAKIYQEVDHLRAVFAKIKDSSIDKRYFKVEIPKGHKVSTSEGKILEDNIFSTIVGSPIENIAHVSCTAKSFEDFAVQLDKYQGTEKNVGKSKFALIDSISNIPFEEKASERFLSQFESDEEEGEALITFFPDLNEQDLESVTKAVSEFLKEKNGEILSFLSREDGALIKVRSKREVLKELAETFLSVQSLDASDEIIVEMANLGEQIQGNVTVVPNTSNAFACFFDTGIKSDNRFLNGSIIEDYCPFGDNRGVGVSHGTFVASRIIFGDSIKDQISSGTLEPDVRVLSVCVSKFDHIGNRLPVTTDQLITVIRDVVEKWHSQIRVYNLSISCTPKKANLSPAIKDDMVHNLASEIDYLSKKYDVLFVVCTGNIPYSTNQQVPTSPYPIYLSEDESRIMSPGEAMLALTVGSIALEEAGGSMAKKEEPSPFTRRGPGFSGYQKPDLVAHGGNCGSAWSNHNFLNVAGFSDEGEYISYARGTSFSTPIVTRLAAKFFELMPSASACLVKAMLIHFCKKPPNQRIDEELIYKLHGHGLPDADSIASSSKNMQSFLYQGVMDYREMIEIPFYVPSVLINRKIQKKVKVTVTITFYPETSSVLKKGYCKSHIRTKICKLNKSGEYQDVSFSGASVLNEDRYSTVIKMEQSFSSGISSGEWKILIAHESRWTLKNPLTNFAAVITVEDPKNDPDIDIYTAIRNEIPNKYKTELRITERIKI